MSYSTKQTPNKPYEFPPPPLFIAWVEERDYELSNGNYALAPRANPPVGQIRHLPTLAKARKRVRDYTLHTYGGNPAGVFNRDWAIYQWDGTEYVCIFSGNEGEKKDRNPLFQGRISNLKVPESESAALEDELAAALASIAAATS